ncbi:MAG: YitT family protein [Prevotellaceae bacterium]|nr:YitT family protein [Prevotellaceae bacterium]
MCSSDKASTIDRQAIFSQARDYLVISFGLTLCTIGWVVFMLPNHITQGGIPGISSVLEWGFGIPVQYTYFIVNFVLLAIALRILGLMFCLKTIYGVFLVTFLVPFFRSLSAGTQMLATQPFLAAVIGGAFMGTGVGLCLSRNGSTGGTDVIAAMINKYRDISLGQIILMVDVGVIASSYFVLKDWEQVIYGYVVLIVATFCVDHVVNLTRRSVQFFIISDKYEEIAEQINNSVNRGCTVINGKGFYSGKELQMLFVLAKQSESGKVFELINTIDPRAFVSQSAVIGVYGQGFDKVKAKRRTVKRKG